MKSLIIVLFTLALQGCFLTKVVTVPLRVGGAVLSVVLVVGNVAYAAIGTTADVIDLVPL